MLLAPSRQSTPPSTCTRGVSDAQQQPATDPQVPIITPTDDPIVNRCTINGDAILMYRLPTTSITYASDPSPDFWWGFKPFILGPEGNETGGMSELKL